MKTEFEKYATMHKNIPTTMVDSIINLQNRILPSNLTPNIIEERQLNAVTMSVFDRLMMDRIIWLGTGIDDQIANIVQAQLLFLESVDSEKDITMIISSGGGSVYSGLGIYDTMNMVKPDVATTCTGIAASMAAVLLSAGEKGKRSALKHSRIMIHQPLGGTQGQASEIEIYYKEMQEVKKDLYDILSETSGQTYETIERWCDRDNWLRSYEAKERGFIDEVVLKK